MAVETDISRELVTPNRIEAYEHRADKVDVIRRAIQQRAMAKARKQEDRKIMQEAKKKITEEKMAIELRKKQTREENKRPKRIETPKENVCIIDISTHEQNFAIIQEWVEAVINELSAEISVVRYPNIAEEQKFFILKAKALSHPEVDKIGRETSIKIAALARKKGISVKCTRYIKTKEIK